ncbi:electron transport complex protein RnfG [Marisediminitalea aggregata]|uniref:Ion-translocating oxidoreductase complex subunit G n=1 Tax=Marisediminitalea aggregata TaxID=634436 RepID=A0A1M5GDF5_9ALTE|nr:electron transport complex subunit RsxG [Marisediminitalea aggregata]SHG01777.1 electron transport complex protein RnfG [Marisediminitalea aggregata]|tara:strand:- start:505 stop:1146 length:642 start_codon:yes stop_codon:yes gene_type:complete
MPNSIIKNGALLALFAVVTTALIAFTFAGTEQKIAEQRAKRLLTTLNEVVPPTLYNNQLALDCLQIDDAALGRGSHAIYRARLDGENQALAAEFTAPDGYSGNIHLILGVNTQGEVLGVRALDHAETPGLGDKIEMAVSDWMLSFNGKVYKAEDAKRWQVKKDGGQFDQFTGATITPRAVVGAVAKTLAYLNQQQATLFSQPANCPAPAESQE